MSKELAKTYDPHGIEDRLYEKWLEKKYFHAEVDENKKPLNPLLQTENMANSIHSVHSRKMLQPIIPKALMLYFSYYSFSFNILLSPISNKFEQTLFGKFTRFSK